MFNTKRLKSCQIREIFHSVISFLAFMYENIFAFCFYADGVAVGGFSYKDR